MSNDHNADAGRCHPGDGHDGRVHDTEHPAGLAAVTVQNLNTPHERKKVPMKTLLTAGLTASALLLSAPLASADTSGYFRYLEENDIEIIEPSAAQHMGFGVCRSLRGGHTAVEISMHLYEKISWADYDDTAAIVVGAVYHLCPELKSALRPDEPDSPPVPEPAPKRKLRAV